MPSMIIAGELPPAVAPQQIQLYRQLTRFTEWMNRPKNAADIRKDQLKPVPVSQLPMVF